MTLWYFETAHAGRWCPATTNDPPRIRSKKGQPDRLRDDTGPRIRGLAEVHPDHQGLMLDKLAAVYGQGGAFYATRPVRAADGSWTSAQHDPQRPGFQAEDSGND